MNDMITTTLLPEPWTVYGACLEVSPDTFFPEHGDKQTAKDARQICGGCDVRAACLAYALKHREVHGIWGATNERQRRRLRTKRRST